MNAASIVAGMLLGYGAAIPIGPINVEIARRTLRGGFFAGAVFGLGAVTVDLTYAVVSSLGVRPLIGNRPVMLTLAVCGIALLIYLGVMSLRAAWKSRGADPAGILNAVPPPTLHGGFVTGFLMTLLNPITLAFWFLVVPATTLKTSGGAPHDLPAICLGVFIAAISWVIGFSGVLTYLGRFGRATWIVVADALGGVVLLGFAAAAIWRVVGSSS